MEKKSSMKEIREVTDQIADPTFSPKEDKVALLPSDRNCQFPDLRMKMEALSKEMMERMEKHGLLSLPSKSTAGRGSERHRLFGKEVGAVTDGASLFASCLPTSTSRSKQPIYSLPQPPAASVLSNLRVSLVLLEPHWHFFLPEPAKMVVAQLVKEAETTEQESLLLTRNLLRIANFNISYIRGLFPDNYFNDKSVPALEMKIKKLMPLDTQSRMLIDWMEKVVYDALPEGPMIEKYSFSFSYVDSIKEEVSMNICRNGNKNIGATFRTNNMDITPDQMRSSACKMIRTLVQLMRTLDHMPVVRTILMKLLYYDDITPEDYEPPFFRSCNENEAKNIWKKNPLRIEVGNVNSWHLVIALKVKSILDLCEDDNGNHHEEEKVNLGADSDQDFDYSSDSEDMYPISDEVKEEAVEMHGIQQIMNSNVNKDYMYMKALYHSIPMKYVTVGKLEHKLSGEANQNAVSKLLDRMVQDGYVTNTGKKRLGKPVVQSEASNKKLAEVKELLDGKQMEIEITDKPFEFSVNDLQHNDHDMKDGSTYGGLHSIGSEAHKSESIQSGQAANGNAREPVDTPVSKHEPIASVESGVLGGKIWRGDGNRSTQEKRSRIASVVMEPILQRPKRQKPETTVIG